MYLQFLIEDEREQHLLAQLVTKEWNRFTSSPTHPFNNRRERKNRTGDPDRGVVEAASAITRSLSRSHHSCPRFHQQQAKQRVAHSTLSTLSSIHPRYRSLPSIWSPRRPVTHTRWQGNGVHHRQQEHLKLLLLLLSPCSGDRVQSGYSFAEDRGGRGGSNLSSAKVWSSHLGQYKEREGR